MTVSWSVSTVGQIILLTYYILETYLKWADMISGLFYLLSDYEQARQHIPPVSWSVSMSGNIYPVWLHGS